MSDKPSKKITIADEPLPEHAAAHEPLRATAPPLDEAPEATYQTADAPKREHTAAAAAEPESASESSADDPTDNPRDDHLVDEIVAGESDELLRARDQEVARAFRRRLPGAAWAATWKTSSPPGGSISGPATVRS